MTGGRDVAVVGAGSAGLAAALRLAEAGARVTVYERGARAGGRMRTERLGEAKVDVGVQLVSSSHRDLFGLAERAGASDLLVRSPGRDALWRKGRAHAITYGSVASMVTSSALPATLKLKMGGRYLPFLTTQARTLDANDPAGTGGVEHDGESIGAWGARHLGDDFVDLLVYPLLAAYYGADPQDTSAGVYHALARMGMDVSVYGAAGGFTVLAEACLDAAVRAGARFVPDTEVTSVRAMDDGIELDTPAGSRRHEATVIAVPAPVAAKLVVGAELGGWLARVRVEPTLTVAWLMDRPFPGDYFGLSFPRRTAAGPEVVALCIGSRKLPGLVPPGADAIVALPAPSATAALIALDDAGASAAMLDAVAPVIPGIGKHVVSAHVTRFEHGYTIFEPGYLAHLQRFDPAWLPPRTALAGDYLVAPSVEGAVRSGDRAAARLVAALD